MVISSLAAFVSTLPLPFLDTVDNGGLGSCTQSAVIHRSYRTAMFDNRADPFCMIEDADRRVAADSSLYDVADNAQGSNLKYQRDVKYSWFNQTCE
ncbi:hypothetical protein PPE03_41820 [Pseudoalteromonas peptidolytica]|nr:hypothetical protein PPE03_41820 [Pseudoalteromonas peptidolytica]